MYYQKLEKDSTFYKEYAMPAIKMDYYVHSITFIALIVIFVLLDNFVLKDWFVNAINNAPDKTYEKLLLTIASIELPFIYYFISAITLLWIFINGIRLLRPMSDKRMLKKYQKTDAYIYDDKEYVYVVKNNFMKLTKQERNKIKKNINDKRKTVYSKADKRLKKSMKIKILTMDYRLLAMNEYMSDMEQD